MPFDEVEDEIIDLIGCDKKDIIRASGKTGEGVEDILEAVVKYLIQREKLKQSGQCLDI